MTEFGRSWLVQRLEPPHAPLLGKFKDNPFSFGGGYKNGGLSDEAMDLIRVIFTFDYMGSAEFEFGAVPKTLSFLAGLAEAGKLETSLFTLPLSKVTKPWRGDAGDIKGKRRSVFVLCPAEWTPQVHERIAEFAAGKVRTKERVGLDCVLRPDGNEYQPRTRGWLELDNGFMFFTDIEMWTKTCSLFGVSIVPGDPVEPGE